MSNSSKRKGDRAELDVAAYLRANGFPDADRSLGAGRSNDRGDITGLPGCCVQVKNQKTLRVPDWMDELAAQKCNAHADYGILIAKKRGTTDVGEWYAGMTVGDLVRLLAESGGIVKGGKRLTE